MSQAIPSPLRRLPGIVTINNQLYITDKSVSRRAKLALSKLGYEVVHERERIKENATPMFISSMYEQLLELRSRIACAYCQQDIELPEIDIIPGTRCPRCRGHLYLEFLEGSNVEFYFYGRFSAECFYTGHVNGINADEQLAFFDYASLKPAHPKYSVPLEIMLERNQGSWAIIEREGVKELVIKFHFTPVPRGEKTWIRVLSSDEYHTAYDVIHQWAGKSYASSVDLPVFYQIELYDAWRWSRLARTNRLWERVSIAAGMLPYDENNSDDRRRFDTANWHNLRVFVDHLTEIDIKQLDRLSPQPPGNRAEALVLIKELCAP